ncbi:MAG: hypothetical protein KDD56_09485, partial [Bdellovibrionales bacterium]|nr:hypothetical protein [Bdellovibrionales bacterium]
ISLEFTALGSEMERIAKTTTFNNINLLSNSGDVSFQIGFDSTENSRLLIAATLGTLESVGLANSGSSALSFSVIATTSTASEAAALAALSAVNTAIDNVNSRRGSLGAFESRLGFAIEGLQNTRLEFTSAESRIRDIDSAQEIAELIRLQVLQQAETAILAQANQTPSTALGLLRDSIS